MHDFSRPLPRVGVDNHGSSVVTWCEHPSQNWSVWCGCRRSALRSTGVGPLLNLPMGIFSRNSCGTVCKLVSVEYTSPDHLSHMAVHSMSKHVTDAEHPQRSTYRAQTNQTIHGSTNDTDTRRWTDADTDTKTERHCQRHRDLATQRPREDQSAKTCSPIDKPPLSPNGVAQEVEVTAVDH